MATRLYLRSAAARQAGRPTGTATTDADLGHAGAARLVCLTLSRVRGDASTSAKVTCVAHPGGGRDLIRIFLSAALASQTLESGERFSLAAGLDQCVGGQGGGEFEQVYLRAYAYLWRPGEGYVATLFGDGTSRGGINDPDPYWLEPWVATWQVMALPALTGDVEVRLRDRIALEVWLQRTIETTTDGYLHYDGTKDDYADGDALVFPGGAASYLEYSGDLLLAEEMTMNSADILVGARDLAIDGVNVGALAGGVTVTYEPSHIEHTVDQRMGVQRVDRVAERMTITANLKEATLENLRIAWGQPASSLSGEGAKVSLNIGGADAVTEHALVLTGKAPATDRTRTITCHKAVAIDTSAHSYTKDDATIYPVTFVLVEDASKAAGFKYMTVEDDEGQFSFA